MKKVTLTVDGNTAAAYIAYAYTDVAAIYPITPSSTMAELVDEWSSKGKENIFGQRVRVIEMQSEAGAAGVFHGSLQAGALTTTFTASQGLLLMIPNMYKVAGELLPGVFHVSARALSSQALSIFGDHQDVMAVRATGCVMLASSSVQEVVDFAIVTHLSAIEARLPFVHFFDGFRTSHEIQKIEAPSYDDLRSMINEKALIEFRNRALSPNHPVTRGTAQNPDIYFQTREACNPFYENVVPIIENNLIKLEQLTGRKYNLFDYYGDKDAEYLIVAMGSVCETIQETIDFLKTKGKKYGLIRVHLFRPFSIDHFMKLLPESTKKVAVLDRTKEPGSLGEPLFLDVVNCLFQRKNKIEVIGGRYGLGSKDTTPSDIYDVYKNLESQDSKDHFTIGINDDVTYTSLDSTENIYTKLENQVSCKFWGLGSDGTVGANKQAIKIIGDNTNQYVQGYFAYDSKKSGGLTQSYLRFGKQPIHSSYLIQEADYIACHNQSYVGLYDLSKGLKDNGVFVLNCRWQEEELSEKLPSQLKRGLAKTHANFYIIDALKIADELGLGNRISMVMQGVFFNLIRIIDEEKAKEFLTQSITKMFEKKGEQVVNMNCNAVLRGFTDPHKVEVPNDWINAEDELVKAVEEPDFIKRILRPMEKEEGNLLPVSTFAGMEDGTFPCGTAAYEKRGIGVNVPEWNIETCIQCNQCSSICPHACIRPFLLTSEEKANAPDTFKTKKAIGKGLEKYEYRIQVSTMDCTGCGNCADICPAKPKALVMKKIASQVEREIPNWNYAIDQVKEKGKEFELTNLRNSQFKVPLVEFSGACAGCGETPYIKLVTQLFGERLMIANATGCSSIWGSSAPSMPYTCNQEGKGPSFASSLFEDNAEYGLGMHIGIKQIRHGLSQKIEELVNITSSIELKDKGKEWLQYGDNGKETERVSNQLRIIINQYEGDRNEERELIGQIRDYQDYLIKPSQWILGGDGWAYDIGYGGLDHVIASGENVNVLVFDTEVYSNTGGQASKSTPTAAVAKFASSGKVTGKKNLGLMMMSYKNVYVAQVAIGADMNQLLKAVIEAEAYNGPSIIIAYATCINHGLKEGMGKSMDNMRQAVDCGYWHLYRYNPLLIKEGKNPFILDSKKPKNDFREYLMKQIRYSSLLKTSPEIAEELFLSAQENAEEKYSVYEKMAEGLFCDSLS